MRSNRSARPGFRWVRKLLFAKKETSKSGRYRVLTFYMDDASPVYLLAVIDKTEVDNIGGAQKKQLRAMAKAMKDEQDGKR